ncbi:acyltransferase family protein [Hoyosella subflava]|uniref:Hypothetical membrane protein n=1 Tax=Hoyosella subflava (strain DSM 45089 / JCM 17490 / NBRC 109087 / DQS3-9A1) TaxID=443218 RepID=F6EKH1_HOYSD|nr:acyltransferase family protein [Hoyosella subflava]AEF39142.1 Hypothetical membrane protein [Hoyosella subflava DQS3-9A1]
MTAPAAARDSRVEWVDVAKGACIALVVLFHATNFWITRGYGSQAWVEFNQFLEPVRMPLFFLAAGLFAGKALQRSWNFVLRNRVALMFYLYLLWLLLRYGYFTLVPGASLTGEESSPLNILVGLVVPHNGLWFVYALGLYFAGAKLIQRFDPRYQVAAAVVLAIIVRSLADVVEFSWTWENMAGYFMFFVLGLHAKELLFALAARTSLPTVLIAGAAYAGAVHFARETGLGEYAITAIVITLLGLAVGVLAAARLRWGPGVRALSRLGALTLPVYLMHEIVMGTLAYGLISQGVLPTPEVVRGFGPAAIAATGIVGALLVHRLLVGGGLKWLFSLPASMQFIPAESARPATPAAVGAR